MEKSEELFDGIENSLIVKYLANECSEAEKKEIEDWIQAQPTRKKEVESFKKIWEAKKEIDLKTRTDAAWNDVFNRIKIEETAKTVLRIYPISKQIMKVAASITFFLILTTAAIYFSGILETKQPLFTWNDKTTMPGEKCFITLSDSTKIVLNAGSKIKYPTRFTLSMREVFLEGEAYFEVAHNASKPFIVHTNNILTTVLGTKFNISAFAEEKEIAVSLVDGKVQISKEKADVAEKLVVLTPNQQLVYDMNEDVSRVGGFDLQKETGWKDNILVFDNEPLSKVFVELERSFGVKFELKNKSIANKKIKANFKNESVWTVANVISKATGLKYKSLKENNVLKKILFY